MAQTLKKRSEGGNTKTPSKRHRNFFFTLNNPEKDDKNLLIEAFTKNAQKTQYLFQGEIGDNGTHHYQGVVMFSTQRTFTKLKLINTRIHWEVMRSKKDAVAYCCKEETHIEGERWTNMKLKPKLIDPMANLKLRVWQQEIINIIKEKPDNRTIYWYWDETGNIGKTTLAKHICMNYEAIYLTGKSGDIKCGVTKYLEKNNNLDVAIFDYPRSLEGYISYKAIEEIKNGIFFNGKYESGMVMFNTPHIIIFANFEPDKSQLSKDRWKIKEIKTKYQEQNS